ncbi:MAG: M3 family metallopeptidase [Steroidobacteraceae bacterium]
MAWADGTLGADTGIKWDLTPTELTTICKDGLDSARAGIARIEAQGTSPPSFASGLGAIDGVVADLNEALAAPVTLNIIAVSKPVRDASDQCQSDAAAFSVAVAADPKIYAIAQAGAAQAQDPEEQQLAKIYLENGRHAGAALEPSARAGVTHLLDEVNDLQIAFQRALSEDKRTIELSVAEAATVPASLRGAMTQESRGTRLAVNESTLRPFLANIPSAAARRRYMVAYEKRGGLKNLQRLARAVTLRRQIATLVGYPNWAAYQLDLKMAKSTQRAEDLVLELDTRLLPKARSEIDVLTALKHADGHAGPLEFWDYDYYEQQLQKDRYSVDSELVRQYLPVEKVVPATLDIYAHLLGVRFEALKSPMAWASQVDQYAIYDANSGAPVGWFFLDLYPREGKYQHFEAVPIRSGRALPDGSYRLPVSGVIGNWPQPEPGKPALLSHTELVTFFHEFGHVMHETLSHTHYASLFGVNVRGDFVEAPSQMLENWMWQPAVLKKVSGRVGTGEPLPDDLIDNMIAAKHIGDGVKWTRQAFFADYDLQLHSRSGWIDPNKLWFDLMPKLRLFHEIPGTYPVASFGHLMGGYDAGYYGYLWSKVYAQDMLSVFAAAGLDNPEIGKRYRNDILVPGGSIEPDVLVERFLGRQPSTTPFYEELGLSSH